MYDQDFIEQCNDIIDANNTKIEAINIYLIDCRGGKELWELIQRLSELADNCDLEGVNSRIESVNRWLKSGGNVELSLEKLELLEEPDEYPTEGGED